MCATAVRVNGVGLSCKHVNNTAYHPEMEKIGIYCMLKEISVTKWQGERLRKTS